jgi:glycosyltransferase involved in cell wall biosynthesis/O-antigen/teichoic acid export membrane protein
LLGSGAGALVAATGLQNLGNLAFHASASRILGPAAYGAVGALLTLTVALTIPLAALQVAITRSVAEAGPGGDPRAVLARVRWLAVGAGLAVAGAAPAIAAYLRLDTLSCLFLVPYVMAAVTAASARGAAVGANRMRAAAASIVATTVVRFSVGIYAVSIAGLRGALLGTTSAEVVGWLVAHRAVAAHASRHARDRVVLSAAELVETSVATLGFWLLGSVDVLLARHYLRGDAAGIYLAAGTAARAVLVLGQTLLVAAMPRFVSSVSDSSADGRRQSYRLFRRIATIAVALTALGAGCAALLGGWVLRIVFGTGYSSGGPVVALLALATIPTALAAAHATYQLARHSRLALTPWIGAATEVAAIVVWHRSAVQIAVASFGGLAAQALIVAVLMSIEGKRIRSGTSRETRVANDPARGAAGLDILIYNWRDLAHPSAGGAEVFVHEVARRWVRGGHRVTQFTAAVEGSPARERVDGVDIVRAGGRVSVYRHGRRYWNREGAGHFDLVFDCINTKPFGTPSFVGETPHVALAHQVAREVWAHETSRLVALVGRYALEPHWLHRYRNETVLTVSESSRASLARYGITRTRVVPEGVEVPAFGPWPAKASVPTLVFCGRLVSSKRPWDAIAAFALLRRDVPDARLLVIGTGPLEAGLRRSAPPGVELLGRLDQVEKFRVMAAAHVLVATSVREGWGLIVSEAAAVGTTSVGYDVAGLRDSVAAAHGRLCAPNPAALARALREVLPEAVASSPRPRAYGGAASWDTVAAAVLRAATDATGVRSRAATSGPELTRDRGFNGFDSLADPRPLAVAAAGEQP